MDSLRALDPVAPLAHGLSRGTAAEGVAMALGALAGGALVSIADPSNVADGAFAGYGLAALVGAGAALVYLGAVATLVHEPPRTRTLHDAGHGIARRVRMVFATARAEAAASVTVRVIFATAVAFGFAMSAVELLWQPHLADLLGSGGAMASRSARSPRASMLAVALGAAASPSAATAARRSGSATSRPWGSWPYAPRCWVSPERSLSSSRCISSPT